MNINDKAQTHLMRLDITVKAAEIKWGILMRLQSLVGEDMAAKFDRQWAALSEAIGACRHGDVCTLADGAVRGVWAMEAAALTLGHVPEPLPEIGAPVVIKEQRVMEINIKPLSKEFWANGGDEINF